MSTNETKRTPAVTADIDAGQGLLNLAFANGKQLNLHISELSSAIREHALLHGLKQKLVDAAAISRDPETGRSATVEDKFQAVRAVYDRLLAGEWNAARGEGGGGAGGLLFRALCRMQPAKQPADIKSWLEGKSDKEKAALRANPKVSAIIDQIKAESVKTDGIDSDSLLDELGD